jgi:hypothetical protein
MCIIEQLQEIIKNKLDEEFEEQNLELNDLDDFMMEYTNRLHSLSYYDIEDFDFSINDIFIIQKWVNEEFYSMCGEYSDISNITRKDKLLGQVIYFTGNKWESIMRQRFEYEADKKITKALYNKILPLPADINELIINKVIITKITDEEEENFKYNVYNKIHSSLYKFRTDEYYNHIKLRCRPYVKRNILNERHKIKIMKRTIDIYRKYSDKYTKEIIISICKMESLYSRCVLDTLLYSDEFCRIHSQIDNERTNKEIKCFDKTFKIFKSNKSINPKPFNNFKEYVKNYAEEIFNYICRTYDFNYPDFDSDSDSDSD